jgi:CHASE2 domain-containing sensor protein
MKAFIFGFLIIINLTMSCTSQGRIDDALRVALDSANSSRIILVNGRHLDRCQLASLIEAISSCSPRSMAVNFIFRDDNANHCNDSLQAALLQSNNVILTVKEEYPSRNPASLARFAKSTGVLGMQVEDGQISRYYTIVEGQDKWHYTLPLLIAFSADSAYQFGIRSKITPEAKRITLKRDAHDFTIIEPDQLANHCWELKDKVVIIGYLGPNKEDVYKVRTENGGVTQTFGTVVLANVVVEILGSMN